jgi:hypothetical protein
MSAPPTETVQQALDSVPLDALEALGAGSLPASRKPKEGKGPRLGMSSLKVLVALFFMFVVVVSDVFTNNVVSAFGEKAVRCRSPTSWGVVLQGIFLVIGYVLVLYLIERGIL